MPFLLRNKLAEKALLKEPLFGVELRTLLLPPPPSDPVWLRARADTAVVSLDASSGTVTPRIAAAFRLMVLSGAGEA